MKIESQGTIDGIDWMVVARDGYRCGYVKVPEEFELLERQLEMISCHGGITYAYYHHPITAEPGEMWTGFDCMHVGDGIDPAILETASVLHHILKHTLHGTARSREFCEEECRQIIMQIREMLSGGIDLAA